MPRSPLLPVVLVAAFFATACQPASMRQAAPAPSVTAKAAEVPACSGEVSRFRAVMANDVATGHVGRQVHDKISRDLDRADSACKAGRDSEAVAIVRLTKAQNGYP